MITNLWPIWIMLFYVSFCNIIKVNQFLYCFIVLSYISSSLSLSKSLLVRYAYVSLESIDCILLLLFELKGILLISSVKTLCFSLLNLCCIFNINLLLFIISLWFSLIYQCQSYFFLDNLFYSQVKLLINSFHNFQI